MVQAVVQTTVTGLQGIPITATPPTVNQSLTFNGTSWAGGGPFMAANAGPFLPLTGGTVTGALNVNAQITTNANLNITGSAGANIGGGMNVGGAITAANYFGNGEVSVTGQVFSSSLVKSAGQVQANNGTTVMGGLGILYNTYAANQISIPWNGGGAFNFIVDGTNLGYVSFTPSDATLKENLSAIAVDCLATLDKITLQQFDWKPQTVGEATLQRPHSSCGFTAQNIQTLIPEAVISSGAGGSTMLSLDNLPLMAYMIGAIQQLSARVGALDHQTA